MSETGGSGSEHPRGTLAILGVYGLLFGVGWVALYVAAFLSRGAPTP